MARARPDEIAFRIGTGVFALALIVVVLAVGAELAWQSRLSIREFGWQFWQTTIWDPVAGQFGARPFIWGTLYSSVLALLIAAPRSEERRVGKECRARCARALVKKKGDEKG